MGYSLSWIAAPNGSREQLNDALRLRSSGLQEHIPESDITSAQLPSGYYLLIFNREEISPRLLNELSSSVRLLYGCAEEHVMYSTVAAWEHGKEQWAVVHDAQESMMHLEVRGMPPEQYQAIRDRLFAEQAADGGEEAQVDHIFEIPVELAYELIGYRYDKDLQGTGTDHVEVMQREKKPGLFARFLRSK